MKVPLIMHVNDDGISICHNKKFSHTKFPIQPFMLAEKDAFPELGGGLPIEEWIRMPGNAKTDYYRIEFDTINDLNEFRKNNSERANKIYYNSFNEQIYISKEDWILRYPHNGPLTVMFWDIEVKTVGDGIFPRASRDPILCIGYSIWNYMPDGSKVKVAMELIKGYDDIGLDASLIRDFVEAVEQHNPDILAGYNSELFDFPYLYERSRIMGVELSIGRNGKEPYISSRGDININGRIHYDIYKKVDKDQTLFGLKSRTLKVIARHYDCPLDVEHDIELDEDIRNTYALLQKNPTKLYAYQLADVVRTEHVGAVYIRNDITLAERVKVPLNNTMNTYSSFIPKLFVGRNEWKRKLICTQTNFNKYNKVNGSIAKLGSKYEGALVGIYKTGYFPKTYKLDFKSMYPSSICTFNLGPDTTELMEVKEYTGKYKFYQDSEYNWYRIPDNNFKVDLIIRVRNDVEGFLKKEIKMLWDERAKIKSEMRAAKESEDAEKLAGLDSQQYAIKVILNSIYGMMGLKSTSYGDMISAVMVTGMCRWTTTKTIMRYSDRLIELDTDGLALDDKVSEDETNQWLDEIILENFGIEDNYMQMELEEFEDAYFYAMKNYVVREGNKFIIHGSSLKSSRACGVVDRATGLAIQHIFNSKPVEEVIREAYDFSNCVVGDFTYRLKLSKRKDSYDDKTGQAMFLAAQVELATKQEVNEGIQIEYVITKNQRTEKELQQFYTRKTKGHNYTFVGLVNSVDEIDHSYYKNAIDKVLDRFGIKRITQEDLFAGEFGPKSELNTIPTEI